MVFGVIKSTHWNTSKTVANIYGDIPITPPDRNRHHMRWKFFFQRLLNQLPSALIPIVWTDYMSIEATPDAKGAIRHKKHFLYLLVKRTFNC